jgi:hypothetical protein
MPQVVTGTGVALTKTVSQLVMELLQNNWPTSAYDPLNTDIGFGLDTWDNYGDIDIHVTADKVVSVPDTIGWTRSRVVDSVFIALYVRKNTDTIPTNMGNAQRKIEEIVKDNAASLGQGVSALLWNGWDPLNVNNNLVDVWRVVGRASAIYYLVKI